LYRGLFKHGVLLSILSYGSYAQAQEWDLGLGIGNRALEEVEDGIQSYVQRRGYTEKISGLEETIDVDGVQVPYLFLNIGYVPRKPRMPVGTMVHQLQLDWMSSFFTEEKDEETISLSYQGQDFGDAEGEWKYKINWYTSLMYGPKYTPLFSRKGNTRISGSFALRGGLSYIDADVFLSLSLKENVFYMAMDPQVLEQEFGIAEETKMTAHVSGFGYFFHPEFTPSIQIGRIELEGHFGYRAELIHVRIEEKLESVDVQKEKAQGKLDLSGETIGIEIKYHF